MLPRWSRPPGRIAPFPQSTMTYVPLVLLPCAPRSLLTLSFFSQISNSFVHPSNPSPGSPPSPTEFQFTLSTSGLDRTVFCTASLNSLNRWVNAFRLAAWEHSRCSEIYTGTLLGLREPSGGWIAPDANGAKLEGWVRVRLPGDLEFRRAWAILLRGGPLGGGAGTIKKAKRHSFFGRRHASVDVPMPLIENLPGDGTIPTLAFFEEKPVSPRRDKLICIAQHRASSFFIASH